MKLLFLLFLGLSATHAFAEEKKMGFANESALGIVATSGNTQTTTLSASEKLAYLMVLDQYKLAGSFLRTSNKGVEQAYQWGLGVRYERELSKYFSVFLGEKVESDKYQNINQRYSTDVGEKYFFKKEEKLTWFSEAGYRFARENYPYGFKNYNFLRLYNEIENKFGNGLAVKWWIEYLPNITAWKAYQFNSELSLSAMLSEIFSLKSAYQIRYYNEPPVGVANTTDSTFTMSMVAKF